MSEHPVEPDDETFDTDFAELSPSCVVTRAAAQQKAKEGKNDSIPPNTGQAKANVARN